MLSYVANHSKQPKTTKVIKLQWIASIWCQNIKKRKTTKVIKFGWICIDLTSNDQNNAKLRKWSNYNAICIDLTSKRSIRKLIVKKRSKQRKTTIVIKLLWIASIWCQNDQKTQNYESDQIIMHCIDLTSKRSKSWVTSQNYKSDQITMNLHRFDVKTIKNVELRRKTFKTTQNYKTGQITMNCIDLMSKRSSNYNALHDLTKTIKNVELRQNYKRNLHQFDIMNLHRCWGRKTSKQRKTTKVILLRWICIDLTSKRSKQRKTTKVIKL